MSDDIEYSLWHPYGKGGQHAGSPPVAVVAWHRDSGIGVVAMMDRSQMRNKEVATTMLFRLLTEPGWCETHQHYKWCACNGGVLGATGYESPLRIHE